jgi:small subunit ribosomal protein S17
MKLYQGVVKRTSEKTISVEVSRQWVHPKYKKTMKSSKKYLVHDEKNQAHLGDQVSFSESKPYSKRKRFAFIKVTAPAKITATIVN